MSDKPYAKADWGEEEVGPGHSLALAQINYYVVFFLPEADADIHNTGKETVQTRIWDAVEDPRRQKQHAFGRTRKGIMTVGYGRLGVTDTDGEGKLF